jgi:hypothetical protein
MGMIGSTSVRRVGAAVFTLAALGFGPGSRAAGECPEKATQVDVAIGADDTISIPADQQSVTIYLDQQAKGKTKVCWVITGLKEDYTLELQRKSATQGRGYFDLQRKVKGRQGAPTLSRIGVPKKAGTWIYGLKLKGPDGAGGRLDPEVIIDPGPKGSGVNP